MTEVILSCAKNTVEQFPFPRAPKPEAITLFIAGHGTEKNENSRKAIERQVELIRSMNQYAGVQAIFMEESPRIAECYQLATTKNLVVVPFFISDGLHTQEDIPVLLGNDRVGILGTSLGSCVAHRRGTPCAWRAFSITCPIRIAMDQHVRQGFWGCQPRRSV